MSVNLLNDGVFLMVVIACVGSFLFVVSVNGLSFVGEGLMLLGGSLGLDYMASCFASLSVFVSIQSCLVIYDWGNSVSLGSGVGGCLWVLILGGLGVVVFFVVDWFLFVLLFESSLVPAAVLILGWGYQPERIQAALQLVIYAFVGGLPTLFSLLWAFVEVSTLNIGLLGVWSSSSSLKGLIGCVPLRVGLMSGMVVKVPVYGLHGWLLKAHVEAPASCSILLSGVTLKVGLFGIIRLITSFGELSMSLVSTLFYLCIWGSLVCSAVCLVCHDLKLVVAYSSVVHINLSLAGVLSGFSIGVSGAVVVSVVHGFCSSYLFYLVGVLYKMTSSRSLFLCRGVLY